MFARGSRASAAEVRGTLTKGKRFSNELFSLASTKNETSKVAVVVPKRIASTAVKRHRMKRVLTHILKELKTEGLGTVVLSVKRDIKNETKKSIQESIQKLLDKAV